MLYSDRVKLHKEVMTNEEISVEMYNGIITILKRYYKNLAINFPVFCPDNDSNICGINAYEFESSVYSYIPNLNVPINIITERDIRDEEELDIFGTATAKKINVYAVMDLLEYIYLNIKDIKENDFHSYFGHYHLFKQETNEERGSFVNDVNFLLGRNNSVYKMNKDGQMERILDEEMLEEINSVNIFDDNVLNDLINQARILIKRPKPEEKKLGLEKIWDAFERMKTYYYEDGKEDKNKSAEEVVKKIAGATNGMKEIINEEFIKLTKIGNAYHIRHFETNKIEIEDINIIDYLFTRVISLINKFSKVYNS